MWGSVLAYAVALEQSLVLGIAWRCVGFRMRRIITIHESRKTRLPAWWLLQSWTELRVLPQTKRSVYSAFLLPSRSQ